MEHLIVWGSYLVISAGLCVAFAIMGEPWGSGVSGCLTGLSLGAVISILDNF